MFAPFDRDTRATAFAHRGARPQAREAPDWLVPLGGTLGWPSNGAVTNLSYGPYAVTTMRRELRAFAPDVVHLHEPVTPVVGWDALSSTDAPLVGTFHCYSESRVPHLIANTMGARRKLNRLNLRLAVSEAAAWTGRRFYGGHYRVIPNGVRLPAGGIPAPRRRAPGEPLRIVFVGQTVERKGLPVLLRAFEALRVQVPAELTIVGATQDEIEPLLVDGAGVTALGRVDDDARHAAVLGADLLCAPSLGGESFGMVLTEAFAAGRPVVASDIAGYRDVVTRRHRRPARAARRRHPAGRDAARPRARPRPDGPARRRCGPQCRALRVAAGGRAGRRRLRRRARRPGARGRRHTRRRSDRRRCHRTAARARPPAGCRRSSRCPPPAATGRSGSPAASPSPARSRAPPAARCSRSTGSACDRSPMRS